MRILVDTHIAIWAGRPGALPAKAVAMLQAADEVYMSPISLWEIAIKVAAGKLDIDVVDFQKKAREARLRELPVTWAHAQTVRTLPPIHRDPFDRLLVAQAIAEPLHFLTGDATLAGYSELVTVV